MSKQTDLINIPDAITVSGSNNVGIGTSSPDSSLHILSTALPQLKIDYNGTYYSTISNNGSLNVVDSGTSNKWVFLRNGTEQMRIDASGNVGIGTSSPRSSDNITTLEISGNTYARHILKATNSGGREYALLSGTSGEFWVYDYTAGAIRFRIDATGAVTMPHQPAFLARPSVGQTNLPNGVTTVTFDTEIFDQNSDFASNTFTAPVAGKYHLDANLWLEQVDTAINYLYLRILTSNRSYNDIISPRFSSDPTYWNFQCSVLADMDAGDTASVLYSQSGTSAQVDIGTNSYFSGYLVA